MKRFFVCLVFFLFALSACQNMATGVVEGLVFFDANGNGIQEGNETGLAGALVELIVTSQNPRTYTPGSGLFRFSQVPVGLDEVLVTAPSGMRITTANARTRVNIFEDQNTNLTIGVGKSLSVGSVTGFVFTDTNGNGTRDTAEPGIGNAILDLTTWAGTVLTVRTDNDGFYQADRILSGDVTVRLRESCGVKSSTGSSRVSRVYVGSVSLVPAIGVKLIKARVSGLIFNDKNSDGIQNSGELGLSGWTVYADFNNNSQYDLNEPAAATCANGSYALENVPDGPARIRHIMNLGYISSLAVTAVAAAQVKPFIVGGQSAPDGAYPFMASLTRSSVSNPNAGAFCGGSLIAPNWVLSAAHCLVNVTPASVDVVLGTNRLENPVTRIPAAQIIIHPSYDTSTQDYDMALIRLSSGVNLPTVQPLLPSQTALSSTGAKATVIGWGDLSDGGRNYPIDLHEAVVPIYDQALCSAAYTDSEGQGGVTERMICAGYPQGGVDACQGDSGGPLLVSSGIPGLWRQTGIVSFGTGCALRNYPGVYSRVSEFNAFLEAQLGRGTASVYDVSLPIGGTQTGVSFAVR